MVMVELEMAYAVIGVLQPGEFDAMGLDSVRFEEHLLDGLERHPAGRPEGGRLC